MPREGTVRVFDAAETEEIFRTASIESAPPPPELELEGLTLNDLIDIGGEAGISVEAIRSAAARLPAQKPGVSERPRAAFERTVEGRFDEKTLAELRELVTEVFGEGRLLVRQRSLLWSSGPATASRPQRPAPWEAPRLQLCIRIVPEGARVSMHVSEAERLASLSTLLLGGLTGLGASGAFLLNNMTALGLGSAAIGFICGARLLSRYRATSVHAFDQKLDLLVERLVARAGG